jgi:hypothetical protein
MLACEDAASTKTGHFLKVDRYRVCARRNSDIKMIVFIRCDE